jgi:hypothetical protein
MNGVVSLSQLLADLNEFSAHQAQTAPFQSYDHFPDQTALHTIGFHQN